MSVPVRVTVTLPAVDRLEGDAVDDIEQRLEDALGEALNEAAGTYGAAGFCCGSDLASWPDFSSIAQEFVDDWNDSLTPQKVSALFTGAEYNALRGMLAACPGNGPLAACVYSHLLQDHLQQVKKWQRVFRTSDDLLEVDTLGVFPAAAEKFLGMFPDSVYELERWENVTVTVTEEG